MFLNSTSEPLMPALTFPAFPVAAATLLTGNLPCQPWPRATAAKAHGSSPQPPGPRPQAREHEPDVTAAARASGALPEAGATAGI